MNMSEQMHGKYYLISIIAGILILLQGILLFAGLILNVKYFTSMVPGNIEMNSVTALCFIGCGIILLLLSKGRKSPSKRTAVDVIALFIILVPLLTLAGHVFGFSFSADQLLPESFRSKSIMAPNTAFIFILVAISLFMFTRGGIAAGYIEQTLIIFSGLVSLLAFLGYLYSISGFYAVSSELPMALNTSILFLLLCIGLLFAAPHKGYMGIINANTPGGFLARRLIPVAFAVPVLLGWLRILGENAGFYSSSTGVALFVIAVIVTYFTLLLYNSYKLNIEETKIKESERKNRENEKMFRAVIDNSPSAIYLKDLNGKFLMVNRATEQNHNQKESEIVGKTLNDLFPGHPESVDVFERNDMEVISAGKAMEFEEQAMLEDGLHTYLSLKFPLFDINNKVYALCGISTDITYRKNDADKFIAILESAPDAVIIVNRKGEIDLVNKQAESMFGYNRKELIGKNIEILVPDELRKKHVAHRDSFLENHSVRPMGSGLDLFAKRKDGTLFPVEISLSPMETHDGTHVSAAIRDISERKKAEKELKELNRKLEFSNRQLEESNNELESFSYSVSHDLRSPLRHVIGFGEKFRTRAISKLDEEDSRLLDKILTSSLKMGRLIDDLLMFSRVGRTEINRTEIDMEKLFAEIINEQEEYYSGEDIHWKIGKLERSNADQFQMKIVLNNLISNAIKYTGKKEKREVEIGGIKNGTGYAYFVKDNGTGFDMKYADKLFGVFQRLHKESEFEGTGIGLATVGRIIKKHGGRVWAEAEPDKGATFYFSIPS